jgi:hypothetical protein
MDLATTSAFSTSEVLRAATERLAVADPSMPGCAAAAAAAAAHVFVAFAMAATLRALQQLFCPCMMLLAIVF